MNSQLLGQKIASIRKNHHHMTQKQLAKFSGIDANYLSRIERGTTTRVSVYTIYQIAQALNVTMEDLINDLSKSPEPTKTAHPNQKALNEYLNQLDDQTSEFLAKRILQIMKPNEYLEQSNYAAKYR
ncbi:MAG: helix-turn-helix transcriptional regulator [Limosilactobacillus sp.]|nr:helix-turn-helix transcriptional regulator [Limosilactobacillus sp.]